MIKKLSVLLLAFVMMFSMMTVVFANPDITLNSILTCDGKNEVIKKTGDIVTVTYTLKNATEDAKYTVIAHTNEIYYDPDFFEYVEGSATSTSWLNQATTFQPWSDGKRSMSFNGPYFGYRKWESEQLVGSFQLKIIATEGEGLIYSGEASGKRVISSGIGDNNGCYTTYATNLTVKIGDPAPGYVVETSDYMSDKKLCLVYTNDTETSFAYSGNTMYDVTSKGYGYTGDETFEQTAETKVYALVVDSIAGGALEDYANNITTADGAVSEDYIIEASAEGLECDLNGSDTIDLGDVVAAYGVYWCDNSLYPTMMKAVLKADVVADKCVNDQDTSACQTAYENTRGNG